MTMADRHALTRRLWDLAVGELTPPGFAIPPGAYEAERPKLPASVGSSPGAAAAPANPQLQLPSAL